MTVIQRPNQPWGYVVPLGNKVYTQERFRRRFPSDRFGPLPDYPAALNLDFAKNKSLIDTVSYTNLITFTRASDGSYVGADGLIKYAGVNEARFDHDPVTGESLGLLVEEARTNLLVRSEEFSTTWPTVRANVSANTTLAPNGTATADSLIEDSTASASHFLSQTVTFAAGNYTFSCYLKANTRSEVRLICFDGTTTYAVYFDTSTGTVVGAATGEAAGSISLTADGWYRCSITFTAAAGTGYARVGLAVDGSQTYTGDGTSGLYIWGAQLEEGSFPTCYIPTAGSAVTRAADVASISGSNFSSWYRQDEGTVFAEFQPRANQTFGVAYLKRWNQRSNAHLL